MAVSRVRDGVPRDGRHVDQAPADSSVCFCCGSCAGVALGATCLQTGAAGAPCSSPLCTQLWYARGEGGLRRAAAQVRRCLFAARELYICSCADAPVCACARAAGGWPCRGLARCGAARAARCAAADVADVDDVWRIGERRGREPRVRRSGDGEAGCVYAFVCLPRRRPVRCELALPRRRPVRCEPRALFTHSLVSRAVEDTAAAGVAAMLSSAGISDEGRWMHALAC